MRNKLAWLFATVAVGFVAWALWPDAVVAEETPTAGPVQSGRTVEPGEQTRKDYPATTEERHELDKGSPRTVEATTTLKGRCVDANDGIPLRGCKVTLSGWRANSTRMEEYLREHPKIEWENPPAQTTNVDGRFEFSFVPPPPYQFALQVTMPGRVELSGRWSKLKPGTTKDLGDIPVGAGTVVKGIVLDTNGAPQDRVQVYLDQWDRPTRSEVHPRTHGNATTGADGRFQMRSNMAPGSWNLKLRGRQLVSSAKVELSNRAVTHLEIRVRPESEIPRITGLVVDENGAPVRNATLDYKPRKSLGGHSWINTSAKDGTFVIKKGPHDGDGPVKISVERKGYEHRKPTGPVAWGTTDLRLVLKQGLTIDLTVKDGDTGRPIEEFGVICHLETRSDGRWSSSDYRVRHQGTHPQGRLLIPGVLRGRNHLVVVPKGNGYALPTARFVDVQDGYPIALTVTLYPHARRPVRVRTAGNKEPVTGTKLQLVEPATDHEIDDKTTLMKRVGRSVSTSAPNRGWLAHETKTNSEGEAELVGHRKGVYALRLMGPGHLPMVVQDVVLDPALGPLEVCVELGATVRGRLRPSEVLRQYQPPKELVDRYTKMGETAVRQLEGLYAGVNLAAKGPRFFPLRGMAAGRIRVREDGGFEVTGIPPGSWILNLAYNEFSGGGWSSRRLPLEVLPDLKDGEVRNVDVDIARLRKAKVEGRVFLNGEPLANTQVNLNGYKLDENGQRKPTSSAATKTDKEGRFTKLVVAGTYFINCYKSIDKRYLSLEGEDELKIEPGESLKRDFHVRAAPLRLRLLAAANKKPLSGIEVFGSTGADDHGFSFSLPPSDKEGYTELPLVTLGVYDLRIWPKHLTKQEARLKLWQKGPDAFRRAQILLDRIRVQTGAQTQEILVPAEAGY